LRPRGQSATDGGRHADTVRPTPEAHALSPLPPSQAGPAAGGPAPDQEPHTAAEARHQCRNFFATATLTVLATSTLHGLAVAPDAFGQLTELLFAVSALLAVGWYRWGHHRYQRSLVPLACLLLALGSRLLVMARQGVAAGPALGLALFLLLISLIFGWLYLATPDSPNGG